MHADALAPLRSQSISKHGIDPQGGIFRFQNQKSWKRHIPNLKSDKKVEVLCMHLLTYYKITLFYCRHVDKDNNVMVICATRDDFKFKYYWTFCVQSFQCLTNQMCYRGNNPLLHVCFRYHGNPTQWHVITHPCFIFNGSLTNPSLNILGAEVRTYRNIHFNAMSTDH